MKKVIAVDLGASNGRLILAKKDHQTLTMEELHRFPNTVIQKDGHLFWDIYSIVDEIKIGLKKYADQYDCVISGIGFDTWGVDFGLISKEDTLLENPYSYRDTHTEEVMSKVHQHISKKDLFMRTGIESASINTIYQLAAIFGKRPELANNTRSIVTMPSLFGYLFTGERYNEFTHASTTQLLHVEKQNWDSEMIEKVFSNKLPLAKIRETNTVIGHTTTALNEEIGMDPIPVINVPGHDTACALASIPLQDDQTVFMSCGTWVLVGVKVEKPMITEEAYQWGFTNEGTIDKTYRLQKNNMGLWLLQQCRKDWKKNNESISYTEEHILSVKAAPFQSLIDPDHEMFFNPSSMTEAIQEFCKQTSQNVPTTKGEIIRCILESLALKYRWVIEKIESLTSYHVPSIHMVGGGIQNKLLCQYTANATRKPVRTGPVEASALGNVLSQYIALGEFENLQEASEFASQSYTLSDYVPTDIEAWDQSYQKLMNIMEVI